MLDIKRMLASAPHKPEDVELQELFTPWGEALAAGDERQAVHPRPQLARENFELLDGWWDYAIKTADEAADAWRRMDRRRGTGTYACPTRRKHHSRA